jgi:hypothetical protein
MLTLDQLASDWLAPDREEDFGLPAITNFRSVAQAAWDLCGIQNWVCAPTAMATPTALLYYTPTNDRPRRFPRTLQFRWKAYEIERRVHAPSGPGAPPVLASSRTRIPEDRPAIIQEISFDTTARIHLAVQGLPRVWRFTDYWNVPPEDVPWLGVRRDAHRLVLDDCKTFGMAEFFAPWICAPDGATTRANVEVYSDLSAWLDDEAPTERGRVGVFSFDVRPGDRVWWHALQGCEPGTPYANVGELQAGWLSAQQHWERTWAAAFAPSQPGVAAQRPEFSGALPPRRGELERLYDMSALSLLMTRRLLPALSGRAGVATGGQCIWNEEPRPLEKAYVVGGPEGAPTTCFLWELEIQAPVLARLDPAVLRDMLEAFLRVDLHKHWGVEMVSGRGAGMEYGINPGAFLSAAREYVRLTGDRAWALKNLDALRSCARPDLTDYGHYQHLLECVSTYEHTIAAFNALNVAGLRFLAELTGEQKYTQDASRLAAKVLELYAGGPFACLQPDGTRRVVMTILDFIYVGRYMTADIPPDMRRGMVEFFRRELQTEDWLRALSPRDPNALTRDLPAFQTFRADHQATGAYDAWPARAASVMCRFGFREEALAWLKRLEHVTHEGPFGQAHYVHPEGARKASFFNGNMYLETAGCAYVPMILDDLG